MQLSIEEIGIDGEGHRLVSLCHYGEQNGDLMRDPDIVFMLQDIPNGSIAEPVSFRNDYLGLNQEVYRYDEHGKRTRLPIRLCLLAGRVHILLRQERGPNLQQLIRFRARQHIGMLNSFQLPVGRLRSQLEPLQPSRIAIQRLVLAFQSPE